MIDISNRLNIDSSQDVNFQIEIKPSKWCSFYVAGSSTRSSTKIDKFYLVCSNRNDYVDTITITIRKNLNKDKTRIDYLHKIVLITTLGDVFVFNTLEELKEHLTEFFQKYPNTIEFGYDYIITDIK